MSRLDLEKLAKDMSLTPYWNKQCLAIQPSLFLPILSRLNYTTSSSLWRVAYNPTEKSVPTFTLIHARKEEAGVEENACKKIRVYPKCPEKVDRQIHACRRAYNLCVAKYREWKKGDDPVDFTRLRREVRNFVMDEASESGWEITSVPVREACQEAKRSNQAVIRNRVKGKKSELRFRKHIETKQSFIYDRLPPNVFTAAMGDVHLTEEIPCEALGKQARLVREYGRYFLIVRQFVAIAAAKNQGNAIGIDPGVRTFATTYAPEQVNKFGEGFAWNILRPLGLQLDWLYSRRKKLFNEWKTLPEQWREDELRCIEKRINKLRQRRSDLIEDLQQRVCYWLVTNYDIIFLPTFAVKEMTRRERRRIGSKTVRSMMDLCHYKFKLRLAWMCRKYGKHLVDVNESYTTRTQSWNGKQVEVNRATSTSDGEIIVDRDVNGARGIYLRAITR